MLEAFDQDSDFDLDEEICQSADYKNNRQSLRENNQHSLPNPRLDEIIGEVEGVVFLDGGAASGNLDDVSLAVLSSEGSENVEIRDERISSNEQISAVQSSPQRNMAQQQSHAATAGQQLSDTTMVGQQQSHAATAGQQLSDTTMAGQQQSHAATAGQQLSNTTMAGQQQSGAEATGEQLTSEQQLLQQLQAKQLQFEAQLEEQIQWRREKEQMVMRYAESERKNLDLVTRTSRAEQKAAEWSRERDNMAAKLAGLKNERQKMVDQLENRAKEIVALRRETERLKEVMAGMEGNLKWQQNKAKLESEALAETKARLEECQKKLKTTREELDSANKRAESLIRKQQEEEVMKMVEREIQQKEQEQDFKNKKQEHEDQQELYRLSRSELELLKIQQKELVVELTTYKDKVQCLENERVYQEETLTQFKETLQKQKTENKELTNRIKELEGAELNVIRLQEELDGLSIKYDELQQSNLELESDMDSSSHREGQHLQHTQRLSVEVVKLQSERLNHISELEALKAEVVKLSSLLQEETNKSSTTQTSLSELQNLYDKDVTDMKKQLAEKSKLVEDLTRLCEDRENDIKTVKRKSQLVNKDLMRQLASLQKQVDVCQCQRSHERNSNGNTTSPQNGASASQIHSSYSSPSFRSNSNAASESQSYNLEQDSRRNATSSLNNVQNSPVNESSVRDSSQSGLEGLDQGVLIRKILKLQNMVLKLNEKIEFLQDHNQRLTARLQSNR